MRIIQMVDSLDYGDAVSTDVIQIGELLHGLGVETQIYSKWYNPKVGRYRKDIRKYRAGRNDIILYHFASESRILDTVLELKAPCIVRYHNVTPPEFFSRYDLQTYYACRNGLQQMKENCKRFDAFLAASSFSKSDLISFGVDSELIDVLPVVTDPVPSAEQPYNRELCEKLKKEGPFILFVGRAAPNKRIEDIMDAFENYYRYHDPKAKLYLVGNMNISDGYKELLKDKLKGLSSKEKIVFTGKVSDEDLRAYYRSASVYLCLSEHEGFCVPLIEAQRFKVPVIAYSSSAVPDTMGSSGVLLYEKRPATIACLLDSIIHDDQLRECIIEKQTENLKRFSAEELGKRLSALTAKWTRTYF